MTNRFCHLNFLSFFLSFFLLTNSFSYSIRDELSEPLVDSPGKTVGSDFNGDGIHDVLISADQDDTVALNAGAAYILYGSGGLSKTYQLDGEGVSVTILGKAASDRFGITVSSGGDINSDGFDDFIISADRNDDGPGANNAGAVYVFYGAPNLSATLRVAGAGPDATILGKAATDGVGWQHSGVGDINGDGFDDIGMTSWYNDDSATNAGAAYILYGAASLTETYRLDGTGVNVTLLGKALNDYMGGAISGVGDMNADGLDDLAVGAHLNNDGGTGDEGAAYILFGSSSLAVTISMNGAGPNVTVLGKAVSDYLGRRIAGIGDVNGDGFSEVLIGAQGNDDSALDAGAAYVIYGRSSLSGRTIDTGSSEEDVQLLGRVSADQFGRGRGGHGDINDDGFHDFMVGAHLNDDVGASAGASYLIYGSASLASSINAGNADVTLLGKAAGDFLGYNAAGLGDINNDGFPDLVVGAYSNDDPPGVNGGAAYIVFGSGSLSSPIEMNGGGPDVTILGKADGDRTGLSVGGGRGNPGP